MDVFIEKALGFYVGNVIAYFSILAIGFATRIFTAKGTSAKDHLLTVVFGFLPMLNILSILAMIEEIKFANDQRKWRKRQGELQAAIEESVV